MATRSLLPARRICTIHKHSFVQNEWHIFTVSIWYFGIDLKWFQFKPKYFESNWTQSSIALSGNFARQFTYNLFQVNRNIFFVILHLISITLISNGQFLLESMMESSVRFYTRSHMHEKIILINTWKCIFITLQNLSNKS